MIFLYFTFIFADPININEDNYLEVLDRNGKKPLFLKVWSPWCMHCKKLAPVFQKLEELPELTSRIEFGEFNCDLYQKACKNISDRGVPSFYYYDSELDSRVMYVGDDNIESFIFFLQKQFYRYLGNITNDEQFSEVISKADQQATFVFYLPLNDESHQIALNISESFKSFNVRFFMISNTSITEKKLQVYRSRKIIENYDGNWSFDSLSQFVLEKSLTLINKMNINTLMMSRFMNKKVAVIFSNDEQKLETVYNWDLQLHDDVIYALSQNDFLFEKCSNTPDFFAVIDFNLDVSWKNCTLPFKKEALAEIIDLALNDKNFEFAYGEGNPHNALLTKLKIKVTKIIMRMSLSELVFYLVLLLFLILVISYAIYLSSKIRKMKQAKND